MIFFFLSHLLNHHNTLMIHFIKLAYFWMKSPYGHMYFSSTKLHMRLKNGDVTSQFLFKYDNTYLFESFASSAIASFCQWIIFLNILCTYLLNLSSFITNGNVINHQETISWIRRRTDIFLGIATMSWHDPKKILSRCSR